jgi:hypothetical protein
VQIAARISCRKVQRLDQFAHFPARCRGRSRPTDPAAGLKAPATGRSMPRNPDRYRWSRRCDLGRVPRYEMPRVRRWVR